MYKTPVLQLSIMLTLFHKSVSLQRKGRYIANVQIISTIGCNFRYRKLLEL